MNDSRRRGAAAGVRRRARGFTLIELLIAAALLAVLAVLAWRGLDSVLASRQRIVAASDELRSLTLAFAQLDEDLRRSWPVRLLKLQTPSITFTAKPVWNRISPISTNSGMGVSAKAVTELTLLRTSCIRPGSPPM